MIAVWVLGVFVVMPILKSTFLKDEIELVFQKNSNVKAISFKSTNFSMLPAVVKNYLKKSVSDISDPPQYSQYTVFGRKKENQSSEWIDFTAQNYYSATTPEFVKNIETQNYFPLWVTTVEKYIDNKASINSHLISSIPVYDFTGSKLKRSYLVLYLLESVFCPTALFPNMNVQWSPIDNSKARATIWDEDLNATAIFHFNKNGEVEKIVTDDRYMRGEVDYEKEKFTIHFANYQNIGKYSIPTFFEYEWNLVNGDFAVGRFQISEISYE